MYTHACACAYAYTHAHTQYTNFHSKREYASLKKHALYDICVTRIVACLYTQRNNTIPTKKKNNNNNKIQTFRGLFRTRNAVPRVCASPSIEKDRVRMNDTRTRLCLDETNSVIIIIIIIFHKYISSFEQQLAAREKVPIERIRSSLITMEPRFKYCTLHSFGYKKKKSK